VYVYIYIYDININMPQIYDKQTVFSQLTAQLIVSLVHREATVGKIYFVI